MKEIAGKPKHNNKSNYPRKLKIDNNTKTIGEAELVNKFSKWFADIGSSLAKNIPDTLMLFEREKSQGSVFINKRIEGCLFFYEDIQKSWR